MREIIRSYCEHAEKPRIGIAPIVINGNQLPVSYLDMLRLANGFVLRRKVFRFFGFNPSVQALDLEGWNKSPWIAEYGNLTAGIVFIAEDIFGDQYGLKFVNETDEDPVLIKFWCEGGETEVIKTESLNAWLASSLFQNEPDAMDWHLATAAFARSLTPSETEHLGFVVPLIVGGDAVDSNLEVTDRVVHLHLLGQLTWKNRGLPEKAKISRFWSES